MGCRDGVKLFVGISVDWGTVEAAARSLRWGDQLSKTAAQGATGDNRKMLSWFSIFWHSMFDTLSICKTWWFIEHWKKG